MKKCYMMFLGMLVALLGMTVPVNAHVQDEVLTEMASTFVDKSLQKQVFLALANENWGKFWKLYKQDKRIVNLRTPPHTWVVEARSGRWELKEPELGAVKGEAAPLEIAVRQNRILTVKKLIRAGAAVNANKGAALRAAVWEENLKMVDILLKNGADPDLSGEGPFERKSFGEKDPLPESALTIAIYHSNVPIFDRLLQAHVTLATLNSVREAFNRYGYVSGTRISFHKKETDHIWRTVAKDPNLTMEMLYKAAMSDSIIVDYPFWHAKAFRLGLAGFAKTHAEDESKIFIQSRYFADLHEQNKHLADILDEFKADPKAFAAKYID